LQALELHAVTTWAPRFSIWAAHFGWIPSLKYIFFCYHACGCIWCLCLCISARVLHCSIIH